MGLPKGRTNNVKGRPKGIPNKTSEELRGMLQMFIEANIDDLQQNYNALEPKEKLAVFERLLKFCLAAPITSLEQLSEQELDILLNKLKNEQAE